VLDQTIILTGWVSKAEDVDTILKVADAVVNGPGAGGRKKKIVNAMQIGGVQQVQLDVTVAQVNRSESRSRGFNFLVNGTSVQFGSILGGLVDTGGGGGGGGLTTGLTGVAGALPSASNIVLGIVPWGFTGLLEALRDEGLAKLLAEPKLVTLSGKSAYFLSGGQQAVISATSGLQGPGIEFKNIGTELTFLPIVQGNGRIYLEVVPRVRTVNAAKGLQFQGTFVPGFDEQSVQTALEIEPGQTMAIGGLIQSQVTSSTRKVPILGDLPYLGSAFNRVLYKDDETELVILVTPHLVDAMDCRQAPKALPGRETRKPDDYELFLESILEAPRGPRQVFEGGRYKAAYKNDPSYNQYPCADPLPREKRHGRMGRGGANGCIDGNCGTLQSSFAPNGTVRSGEMMPSSASPLLPGSPMPGPALGSDGSRSIPPADVESLPAPRSGRARLRSNQGPPQPRFDDESPR
jgi:pilus assembly protein CpaC